MVENVWKTPHFPVQNRGKEQAWFPQAAGNRFFPTIDPAVFSQFYTAKGISVIVQKTFPQLVDNFAERCPYVLKVSFLRRIATCG